MLSQENIKKLRVIIQAHLDDISPDERVKFIADITTEYCIYCGYPTPDSSICHCMNDD